MAFDQRPATRGQVKRLEKKFDTKFDKLFDLVDGLAKLIADYLVIGFLL